ncbi:MAG TPA: hypothetical protein VNY27_07045 [Solirubrobacteraceae bacterium]|jgi:hypothetical protein|nr:hypothetical protein [Solirubrobacteraceae bacterium]
MSDHLPVHRFGSTQYPAALSRLGTLAMTRQQERALVKHAAALQRRMLAIRAEDVARRQIATGRMHDIKSLTKDALEAGGEIADSLAYEVQAQPYFARELADIASTGARGLKAELAYYIEESH